MLKEILNNMEFSSIEISRPVKIVGEEDGWAITEQVDVTLITIVH